MQSKVENVANHKGEFVSKGQNLENVRKIFPRYCQEQLLILLF